MNNPESHPASRNQKPESRIEVTEGRSWRVPLSPEEMGLHGRPGCGWPDYLRAALDEKARSTVKELIRAREESAAVGGEDAG